MSTRPYRFQLEDCRQIRKWGCRGLISWEMGLGKTYGALRCAALTPEARPILIICPASLKWNWQRECMKHYGWNAVVLQGTEPEPAVKMMKAPEISIINYDILFPRRLKRKVLPGWQKVISKWKPKLVIIDECQKISNRGAKCTEAVRFLCQGVPHVLALSGTPIQNRPAEFFSTLNILRPDMFPSWFPFGHRYCGAEKNQWGWQFKGASNTQELYKMLTEKVMVRRKKEEVLTDLPTKQRIVTLLELDDYHTYQEATQDFLFWLRKQGQIDKADSAARAEGVAKITILLSLIGRLKLNALKEWIGDFLCGSDAKLIVYAIHQEVVRQLHEQWRDQSVYVTGSVTGSKRDMAFRRFVSDSSCRLFVGNIEAAGTGWSALGCSNVAFAELAWKPGVHNQAGDRVHGIGRGEEGKRSQEWWLIAQGTLEEWLCRLLQQKQKVLNAVTDGKDEVADFDVFSQLCKQLSKTI